MPRHRVARVLQDAQVGDHVLHMCGLDELEPAELHERDIRLAQLDFEVERKVARAEEDCDVSERDTLFAKLQNLLDDETRLQVLGRRDDDAGQLAARAVREELFGVFVTGVDDLPRTCHGEGVPPSTTRRCGMRARTAAI